MEVRVLRETSLALALVYEIFSIKMGIIFCKDLLIKAAGTSSPQIGGASAIVIILSDV